MQWFYVDNGQQAGPVTDHDIERLHREGKIAPDTLVWHAGMAGWEPYSKAKAPSPAAAPAPQAAIEPPSAAKCCECGKEFSVNQMVRHGESFICATCKPVFFQRLQEGAALPGQMVYAGFWIRFAAKFLDNIILGIVNQIIALLSVGVIAGAAATGQSGAVAIGAQLITFTIQLSLNLGYYVFMHGRYGATIGKMACKIKVVRPDGGRITYWRALGRAFAEGLSYIILGIGYIMAAFDEQKRALHDRICDTRVIKIG